VPLFVQQSTVTMSDMSTGHSSYSLAYPSDNSVFASTPCIVSLIDYKCIAQWGNEGFTIDSHLEEVYILQGPDPLFKREIPVKQGENTNPDEGTQHPEAPWFCWQTRIGQLAYSIRLNTRAKSYTAHTSTMVYSTGSLMKWGWQVSATPSLLEKSMPALTQHLISQVSTIRTSTSSLGTSYSTLCSNRLLSGWKTSACSLKSPICVPWL